MLFWHSGSDLNYCINYLKINKMKHLKILKYVGFGILGVGFVFLAIYFTQSLWNWLIPELFHGPVLSYWQTAGLFILCKILLTGVAPGGSHHKRPSKEWHSKYNEKFKSHCEEVKPDPAMNQ
jgi:hypothetical protein